MARPDSPHGPTPEELARQREYLRALLLAFERSETLLSDIYACETARDAEALVSEQLGLDEDAASFVLAMQLRRFPRQERQKIQARLDASEDGGGGA
ncbi:hypothetical protein [Nocardioides zeae]|uniref:DNA gyrase/topoisomerase IV subunit A n=1 Tax=Nocardioides zeae TaxID=1457234 RepID=A0AAJ1U8S9_9ACTN|nr:hypothetical protein [Nocardioides zeae]MDQ1105612.1 DNA gyrase/topoisomerase IV subunit A [Nocardioides zeae]